MIKINLLGEVRTGNNSHTFYLIGYTLSLLLCAAVAVLLYTSTSSAVQELTEETELLQKQLKSLEEKTKSVNEMERKRSELDAKLKVITTLKKSKAGPVRVLDDLNTTLPERSWITALEESEGMLKIVGFALDNQTVATWMKDLVGSEFFESVDLVETKAATQQGAKIRSFTLNAKINYAGKEKKASGASSSVPAQKEATSSSAADAQSTGSSQSTPAKGAHDIEEDL